MELNQNQWIYGGAIFLIAASSLVFSPAAMTIWAPTPVHLLALGWVAPFLAPLATPFLYVLVLRFMGDRQHFSRTILMLVVVLSFLNATYLYESWHYGVTFQGEAYTQEVAILNLVGFGSVLLAALWAYFNNSRVAAYAANLSLFALLSWCAFPTLGELP